MCRGCEAVEQIWVYGNSYESTLVAVVVPDKKELMGWAKENGVDGDFEALVKSPKVGPLNTTCALSSMCKCEPQCCAVTNTQIAHRLYTCCFL